MYVFAVGSDDMAPSPAVSVAASVGHQPLRSVLRSGT